jgi:hypothetical protein
MAEEPQIERYLTGEGGACGAPGIAHIDMPLTPETLWRAIAENGLGTAAD